MLESKIIFKMNSSDFIKLPLEINMVYGNHHCVT